MTSPPLDSTHCWQHRAWHDITALDSTNGRKLRTWHDITALGQHTRSATLGVASHHRPWLAHTVGRRRPWHEITTLGQHTLSNNVRRGMPSSPLGITHDRTTSGVTCHHRLWTAHTVRLCGAWHDINAFGQHTRSTTSGVACHHRLKVAHTVKRRRV